MASRVKKEPTTTDANNGGGNVFKIMIATDTHLGYKERDAVRGEDSFTTFEEVLKKANEMEVDFILHGGDLFHDNKPSRPTMFKCMQLLRKYCMGERKVAFQISSDQSINFHNTGRAHFLDENYHISIPVFGIHGNHDDPAGDGSLCSLDILSMAGLVDYFGKATDISDVTIHPILLEKGDTKVAIYGLGNLRDERLYQTFKEGKVKLVHPTQTPDDWLQVLVLHQNRVAHSSKNFIPEELLDQSLDLVVWGHEHDSQVGPKDSLAGQFAITQPGSSVATSLCEGECGPKNAVLLEIRGSQWRITPIPLETVRPFVMQDVNLREEFEKNPMVGGSIKDEDVVIELLSTKVEELIKRAHDENPKACPERPDLPLIRVRVDYTGGTTVSAARFGQRFVGKVANPKEIVHFHRKRKHTVRGKIADLENEEEADFSDITSETANVSEIISSFLDQEMSSKHQLDILPKTRLRNALDAFVSKNDGSAISSTVSHELKETQKFVQKEVGTENMEEDAVSTSIQKRKQDIELEEVNVTALPDIEHDDDDQEAMDVEQRTQPPPKTQLVGTKRKRATAVKREKKSTTPRAKKTAARKARYAEVVTIDLGDSDEEYTTEPSPPSQVKKSNTPRRSAKRGARIMPVDSEGSGSDEDVPAPKRAKTAKGSTPRGKSVTESAGATKRSKRASQLKRYSAVTLDNSEETIDFSQNTPSAWSKSRR